MQGIHLIGDLYDCQLEGFCDSEDCVPQVKNTISKLLYENNLKELGSSYYFFFKDAVTGVIALAESHISFHSWPENKFVSMDIFVCNYNLDNTRAAERIFTHMETKIFKSGNTKKTKIKR